MSIQEAVVYSVTIVSITGFLAFVAWLSTRD